MLEKAGNCFHLAMCYDLAVEEYAKAGAFDKCLSVCTEGNLFEVGFELLGRCGECGRDELLEFLQKGADHYLSMKDFKSMMKFVHSFYEKGEMRSFLTQRRCYDQLIYLEEEWGNFKEAAKLTHEGAHYYYSIKDFESMMKFVRYFREKGEMRSFLTQRRCYDQLIYLEEEWGNFKEAAKLTHEGAHYYYSIKDFESMMKFVRSFCEKDEMRRFLSERRCFDQLVFLEKDWGNFEEAAKLTHEGAHYYFSIKKFESMMKFVHSFCEKDEMRRFLSERQCFDQLIYLEKEWGNFKEAAKLAHECAHYYFSNKEFESMMKFVRLFSDKGEMRSFLTDNRRLDELILLEREWGNFKEAAKVARLKPDPVLEADLFHMGGFNRESSLVILWHVFLNSPIFQNVDEPFSCKNELLKKAISIARSDSYDFYQFVCQEAEFLSHGETKEVLLENALEFIYCYKENALAVRLDRVKTSREIKKIETNVIDLMRSLLKSTNRLNKLLLLDEVYGEFVEAAKLGNEDEHSIEAALSRLWYVFFGSLWACGRRAFPLTYFKYKMELLDVASSYVTDHPDSLDSALVHTEVHVLSGEEISLSHLWRYMKETPREKSLRIHFLISRRILDIHLSSHCKVYAGLETQVEDEKINHLESSFVGNTVSIEGLIYFWNYWKEMIYELINWSHTGGHGCKIYTAFIFNYFGVRKYDGDRFVVLDAEAHWVKETRPTMIRTGYLHIILPCQFSSAASRYWCSELLFVAEKVFQSLHAYSFEKNLSVHQQTKVLTCMFEVVKSLQKCEFPNGIGRKHASRIIDKYSQLCVEQFLWNVTHINWEHAQSKEMICIRRNDETFYNMLNEAININSKSLKFGQLGRITVVLLGYKWTGFNERELRCSSAKWTGLFRKLLNRHKSVAKDEDLAIILYSILKETFSAGWQGVDDCMSPACFLYLMDRLLILSFGFRGYVLTTRASCVEWLSYGEWGMGSGGGCLDTIHHSLAQMVIKMLNSQDELMEWLRRSKEPESSFPILVLRLTVLLSLICANSGLHYHELSRQLTHASLPSDFCVALFNGIKEGRLVEAVAVACKMIDNPLVIIVSAKKDSEKVECQNAIYLNMERLKFDKESFIEMLYHKECKDT